VTSRTLSTGGGRGQGRLDDGSETSRVRSLAFPDDDDDEAEADEFLHPTSVPLAVGCELGEPEIPVSLRNGGLPTAFVSVPEAAVNEQSPPSAAIGQIGRAGEIPIVRPEPMTQRMDDPTDRHFGLGSTLTDAGHPFGRHGIHDQPLGVA